MSALRHLLLASLLGFSTSAPAALIEADLFEPGDGLVTRDTATGLDWLDLSLTLGLSVDDFASGAGGWVSDGWRYATGPELCDVFSRHVFAISPCPAPFVHFGNAPDELAAFIDLMTEAPMAFYPGYMALFGFFDDGGDPNLVGQGFAGDAQFTYDFFDGTLREGLLVAESPYDVEERLSYASSYLVRPIPEPAPGTLVGLGLASLALSRRRRGLRGRRRRSSESP